MHSPLQRSPFYQLSRVEQSIYKSSIQLWFEDYTSLKEKYFPRDSCWRAKDGVPLCPGKREDSSRLVLSIPVLLILETPEDSTSSSKFKIESPWDFPPTLTPSTITKSVAKQEGITYDLVGLAFFSPTTSHFITRYAAKRNSEIYKYDGMKNGGYATREKGARFSTHLAGQVHPNIPSSYSPCLAIYHLRGGANAQEAFYRSQTQACTKKFNLHFSTTNLSTLPNVTYSGDDLPIELRDEQRIGEMSPQKCGLKEYVSRNYPIGTPPDGPHDTPKATTPPTHISITSITDEPESEDDTVPQHEPVNSTGDARPSTPESLPDSVFEIKCRCGLEGNGNIYYDENEGEAVQCNECECWSHIACQTNGRASKLRVKDPFFCDFCQVRAPGIGHSEKDKAAERR